MGPITLWTPWVLQHSGGCGPHHTLDTVDPIYQDIQSNILDRSNTTTFARNSKYLIFLKFANVEKAHEVGVDTPHEAEQTV